jgi:hypothetical protein
MKPIGRRHRRGFAAAAGTLLLAAGGVTAATHAASAATIPDCYGSGNNNSSSCYGLDPIAEACSGDATTIYSLSTSVGTLEHRYSSYCNASWVRITGSSAGTWFYIQTCYASYLQSYNVPSGSTTGYSNMVPGKGATTTRVGDSVNHGPC